MRFCCCGRRKGEEEGEGKEGRLRGAKEGRLGGRKEGGNVGLKGYRMVRCGGEY